MPLPRFEKLAPARQQAILDAAAMELAAHGAAASFNRIIQAAGVSKGAMYYYFADRDDLLRATVEHHIGRFLADMRAQAQPADTAEAFWMEVARMVALGADWFADRPVVLAMFARLAPARDASFRPQGTAAQVMGVLQQVIAAGQRLGAVRLDLPPDYMLPLMLAVARVSDQWLLTRAGEGEKARAAAVATVVATYRRLMEPARGPAWG